MSEARANYVFRKLLADSLPENTTAAPVFLGRWYQRRDLWIMGIALSQIPVLMWIMWAKDLPALQGTTFLMLADVGTTVLELIILSLMFCVGLTKGGLMGKKWMWIVDGQLTERRNRNDSQPLFPEGPITWNTIQKLAPGLSMVEAAERITKVLQAADKKATKAYATEEDKKTAWNQEQADEGSSLLRRRALERKRLALEQALEQMSTAEVEAFSAEHHLYVPTLAEAEAEAHREVARAQVQAYLRNHE